MSTAANLPGQVPLPACPTGSGQVPTPDGRFPRSAPLLDLPGQVTGNPGQATCPLPATRRGGQGAATPATCVRGTEGRVLRDRHNETCNDDGCLGCQACPGPHCTSCRREHAEQTCPRCLALAREKLDEAVVLTDELPAQAIHGRQARNSGHGIPGGDAVVMLAAAAPRRPRGSTRPVYAELGDPRPPLDVLTYWTNVWQRKTGNAIDLPPTMGNQHSYLDGQLHLIAQTPLFHRLLRDLSRVVYALENVLHAGDRADRSRVPCLACGTRVVKVWTDTPAKDHWRCPTCGEVYDRGRYERAKHDQLASRGADRFVPLSDAVAVTGRPEQTVRTWMRLGYVETRKAPKTGRLEVWWPDVRDRHRTTPTRRRGRTA